MPDKELLLFDENINKDTHKLDRRTDIMIYIEGTDELVFRGSNKVIIAGAGFTARSHFDLPRNEVTPSYNTVMNLQNTVSETPSSLEKVYLFAVGTDGCGPENSQVYPVDYKKWIAPNALVPFRYQLATNDITGSLRNTYYGRKETGDRVAYYFKAFESAPTQIQQYLDGTPIDSTIYDSTKADEAETYVEIKLKVLKEDCRDWFLSTTGISDARINTISLLTAWAKTIDGIKYYQDIRPLTKLNIPNESLIDLTKGLDIIYHIYY